ncbi:flagellar protein FlaG [Halanaerobium sp.]|uniref:flagellar protein FlaG n=1 Tax=Halanaerobium sp. TaxID=1895664 RepID=UPI000DE69B60|nr:flagellar protein FlaG [Halanaerobium sp.]PUU88176.1 MAG: flagellar protein FlaG [Halanaerobium sp.]
MKANSIDSLSSQQYLNKTNNNSNNDTKKIVSDKTKESLQEELNKNSKSLEEEVKDTVKDVNEIVKKVKEGLSFQIHEDTEELMVQVVDLKTDEVIKELPPEEMLDLKARIHEMVGILIDEKV